MSNKIDLSKVKLADLFDSESPVITEQETTEESTKSETNEEVISNTEEEVVTNVEENVGEEITEETEEEVGESVEETEEEESVIAALKTALGYEVEGEFTEDITGVIDFAKTVAENISENKLSALFQQFPDVQEYLMYRMRNGDPSDYFKLNAEVFNYSSVKELKEEDKALQRRLLTDFATKVSGLTDEDALKMIDGLDSAGQLYEQANIALKRLQAITETEKENNLKKQEALAKKQQEDDRKTWESIHSIISKGELKGISIPEKQKTSFFNWMAVPVDNSGRSQRDLALEQENYDNMLTLEYLRYLMSTQEGFDLGKLTLNRINTAKAQQIKKKLLNSNKKTSSSRLQSSKKTQPKGLGVFGKKITLDDVFG